jgi:LacI family transcriptional regulator
MGLIIASHRQESDSLKDFDWSRFSAVKIDFAPREPQLHMVTNDQSAIIRLAVQRVWAAGYRRIGFVMPRWWDEFVDLAWSAGFLAEQQRLAPKDRIPILYYSTPLRTESSRPNSPDYVIPRKALEKWLRTHKPEVLVSYGPFVRPCLTALGLSVPEDFAFAEIFLEESDGQTAGVHQNCHRVGQLAVELLAGQLHQHTFGIPSIPTATFVEGTWFDGKSLPPRRLRIPEVCP